MKLSTHALSVLLVAANSFASAFAPASFTRSVGFSNSNQFKVANIIVASSHGRLSSSHLNLSSPSGYVDGDDEDEDGTLWLSLCCISVIFASFSFLSFRFR